MMLMAPIYIPIELMVRFLEPENSYVYFTTANVTRKEVASDQRRAHIVCFRPNSE